MGVGYGILKLVGFVLRLLRRARARQTAAAGPYDAGNVDLTGAVIGAAADLADEIADVIIVA